MTAELELARAEADAARARARARAAASGDASSALALLTPAERDRVVAALTGREPYRTSHAIGGTAGKTKRRARAKAARASRKRNR